MIFTSSFSKLNSFNLIFLIFVSWASVGQRQMENLDRGTLAVRTGTRTVLVSWRVLAHEFENTTYNVYFNGSKVNNLPIVDSSNFLHNTRSDGFYSIATVVNDVEQELSPEVFVWADRYKKIPLSPPSGGTTPDGNSYSYEANDASIGDLDGDGSIDLVLKWFPSNSKDNAQSGYTGSTILQGIKLDGTLLWTIDLGKNIRSGSHYTQFLVYDFDGDGSAEIACKTADGTVDGAGEILGDENADYRSNDGRILEGPEYLSVFSGQTGEFLIKDEPYDPPRDNVADWGDSYGNRVDRFLACVAYLDGEKPSMVFTRGYYNRTALVAYDFSNGELTKRWKFDTAELRRGGNYEGQGNHNINVGDIDDDQKDEIIFGSLTFDDDGNPYHSTGYGHGDASHLGDFNPNVAGLEYFTCHETAGYNANNVVGYGFGDLWTSIIPRADFREDKLETIAWQIEQPSGTTADIGRALVADIDSTHVGAEAWASDGTGIYNVNGDLISSTYPTTAGNGESYNMVAWYDDDLLRELVDRTVITKWNAASFSTNRILTAYDYDNLSLSSNNSSKSNPCIIADILGDWREEIIWRSSDNTYLAIMTSPYKTDERIFTLLHDPLYRISVAFQNVGYNQPAHTGFYLGVGMSAPDAPNIYYANSDMLSTKENYPDGNIKIFPNPTEDEVYIKGVQSGKAVVFDLYGNQLLSIDLSRSSKIDFKNKSSGVYIIKIIDGTNVKLFKQIVR